MSQTFRSLKTRLPSISTSRGISYSQRYEYITRVSNYGQMTQNQILKEYERLRLSLKELNNEVVSEMERRSYSNNRPKDKGKDIESILMLLQDEENNNEIRINNFNRQLKRQQDRLKYLMKNEDIKQSLQREENKLQQRKKSLKKEIYELKLKMKIKGNNLVNKQDLGQTLAGKQSQLGKQQRKLKRYEETIEQIQIKLVKYRDKIKQLEASIQSRMLQFSQQENFIVEEIHLQRYKMLKKKKQILGKYQQIYKRNYLIKLKELDSLVGGIGRHNKSIKQAETNNSIMCLQIDQISSLLAIKKRKRPLNDSQYRARKSHSVLEGLSIDGRENEGVGTRQQKNRQKALSNDKNNGY